MEDLGFEIRKHLNRYLAGDISIADFDSAIAPLVWNIEKRADLATVSLGREIELLLAEASRGDLSETALREQLAPVATTYAVTMNQGVISFSWTSAGNSTVRDPASVQSYLLSVGTRS